MFTGQYQDRYNTDGLAGQSLYWMGARYYDPALGRFISPDSVIPDKGNPQGFDRYSYVANNPISRTDESGHCWGVAKVIQGLPSYKTTCKNLDKAWTIVQSDKVSAGNRVVAGAYITGEFVAHGTAVFYGAITACALASAACYAAITGGTAACSDGDCTNEIQLSAKLGQDVWRMNPFDRGWEIEAALGRSPQLVDNFPTIDRFENGIVTSIKSINLAASSYQNLQTLQGTLEGYVTKLANFNGASYGGFTITQNMISGRQLLLAIPPNASADQLMVIQNIVSWAASQGVTIVTQVVK